MAARASMVNLVARVRALVNDAGAVLHTDDAVQSALDQGRTRANYTHLVPEPTTTSSLTQYLTFVAPLTDWEEDVALVDGNYGALTAATSDYVEGRWTFATEPLRPVRLTGWSYDIYGAAARLLRIQLSTWATRYDFAADGGDYKRNQAFQALRSLLSYYEGLSRNSVVFVEQVRPEVNPHGW